MSNIEYELLSEIRDVIVQARERVQRTVNSAIVDAYWSIGRLIVEHEQQGEARAAYGKRQLQILAERLTTNSALGSMSPICAPCADFISPFQFETHCVSNWAGPTTERS